MAHLSQEDGSIDWLSTDSMSYGYTQFSKNSVDTILMEEKPMIKS